jgi:hypothetical protein
MTNQDNHAGGVKLEAKALEAFTEYFVRNYPGPDTIIGNPQWHAPKIFRAALYAIDQARLAALPAAGATEPRAWEGYWAGAGSVNSETALTRSKPTMEKWAADGAEITPLFASPLKPSDDNA